MPCGHGTSSYHICIRRLWLRCFLQPPELVAQAFREVLQEELYKHSFSKVVFAIKSNGRPDDNYNVFAQVLGQER